MIKLREYKNYFKEFYIKLKEDNISEYAAEAAYFSIISFIPFLIFFVILIKNTNIETNTIIFFLNEIVPSNISNILINIIEEIYLTTKGNLSFSFIFIIWAAGKGFFSLSKGIRNIYKINTKNKIILRIAGSIYTVILVLIILVLLIILFLGKTIYILLMRKYYQFSFLISFLYKLRIIFFIFLMTIFFYFLYKIASTRNKNHIKGAFFSAIFWQILSYIITIYMDISSNFSILYGSLSSLILIMLWVYFGMYIIFIGAEINSLRINSNKGEESKNISEK